MAQETDEGLAYLQALKGSAPAPTARAVPSSEPKSVEASARAPAQDSAAPQTFAREKRSTPRYAGEVSTANAPLHETDEGLAYLQALKQSAPTAAAGAPAHAPNSGEAPWRAQVHNSAGPQTFVLEKRRSPRYKCEGSVEICQEGFELRTWATCTDENRTRLRALLRTISRPSVILGPGISPSAPWGGALMSISLPTDATAALRALAEFFESRQLLMRDEFLRILRKSQGDAKPLAQGQRQL